MGVLIAYGVGHIGCRSSGRIILEVGVFSDISAGYAVFYNGVAIACYPAGTVSARAVIDGRIAVNEAVNASFIEKSFAVNKGMCRRSDAEIFFAMPIFQIVLGICC